MSLEINPRRTTLVSWLHHQKYARVFLGSSLPFTIINNLQPPDSP